MENTERGRYIGDRASIRIFNADNQIVVFLNGRYIYSKSTEGDPNFDEDVRLDLRDGENQVLIVSSNWGGPAHVKYVLSVDEDAKDVVDRRVSNTPNGVWYYQSIVILK
ncbi:hypothetical protein [Hoeflea sp. BAL378]|uniref:hypothetical protein n=1 Tax=Hoeflea sp. BAL378 TaxID=1547437 RepID=UPI000552ACBD|nr:hypothetical protein [Hoeflea sp. BAL378]